MVSGLFCQMDMVGIAQLVSAPDCGSGGQGFESLYPPFPYDARFIEEVYRIWVLGSIVNMP